MNKMKPWVKTALTLGAISVALGLGYTIYYFGYAKRKKDKQGEETKPDTPETGSNDKAGQEKVNTGLGGRVTDGVNNELSGYVRPGLQGPFTGNLRPGATRITTGFGGRAGAGKITE